MCIENKEEQLQTIWRDYWLLTTLNIVLQYLVYCLSLDFLIILSINFYHPFLDTEKTTIPFINGLNAKNDGIIIKHLLTRI